MIRANETEDPLNEEVEDDSQKIYLGPGYRRIGSTYTFGSKVQPSPPRKSSSSVQGTGNRIPDRLTFALDEQRRYVEDLEERLQTFADKTLSNLERGGPVVRSGEFSSIMGEIQERCFLIYQIEERLAKMPGEQKEG